MLEIGVKNSFPSEIGDVGIDIFFSVLQIGQMNLSSFFLL